MISPESIFEKKFVLFDKSKIVSDIKENGFFHYKNAFKKEFTDTLIDEVKKNKFSVNKNWVTGVYSGGQYYVKHLLSCSKQFYNLISNEIIFDFCDLFFKKNYRLKAFRYYETYSNHKMSWHTDNKISKKDEDDIYKEVPGIIFIIYLSDVDDGEFQFIKKSHKFSDVQAHNDYNNDYILNNYKKDIMSFKGEKGDLIIYDTYGIHRAKPVSSKRNFVRKSLFFQIDTDLNSAEPSLINPSYFLNLDKKSMDFFGFGLKNESDTYPNTNVNMLPFKLFFSIFFKYIYYKLPRIIYNLLPKKLKLLIKKIL